MRGFIDRARDYLSLGLFEPHEAQDIEATISLYDDLKGRLNITEEDLENIENLLSVAELAELLNLEEFRDWLPASIAANVRRFIELVIARSIRLPSPTSAQWVGPSRLPHQDLVAALAYYGERATVVTVNYDCIVEYSCYCVGLPYTYNRSYGPGVEILKLHGSSNWLYCSNNRCPKRDSLQIAELIFHPTHSDDSVETVEPNLFTCTECGLNLHPVLVPPTWGKALDHPVLHDTWSRAAQVLSEAEVLTAVGYSLPAADAKVRDLFNLGFSSGILRQAMVVIGNDEAAAERWSQLFRKFWRDTRLEIRSETFEQAAKVSFFPSLVIPENAIHPRELLPPFDRAPCFVEEIHQRLEDVQRGLDWATVMRQKREGRENIDDRTRQYRQVLEGLGFDWLPSGPNLPSHGTGRP
jgi:hypothetical protein